MSAKETTENSAKSTATGRTSRRFTAEERAAVRERAQELKVAARGGKADGESNVLAKIAEMPESDRAMAERLHAINPPISPSIAHRLSVWVLETPSLSVEVGVAGVGAEGLSLQAAVEVGRSRSTVLRRPIRLERTPPIAEGWST